MFGIDDLLIGLATNAVSGYLKGQQADAEKTALEKQQKKEQMAQLMQSPTQGLPAIQQMLNPLQYQAPDSLAKNLIYSQLMKSGYSPQGGMMAYGS